MAASSRTRGHAEGDTVFYFAQYRSSADKPWHTHGWSERRSDAACFLDEKLQEAGFHYSELDAHLADLAAGHVLTADNGTQFRVTTEPLSD